MDLSIMCMELLLMLLHKCKIDIKWAKQGFNLDELFSPYRKYGDINHLTENTMYTEIESLSLGLNKLNEIYRPRAGQSKGGRFMQYSEDNEFACINTADLWCIVLCGYRFILGFESDYWRPDFMQAASFRKHIKKFWDLMQIIH